jgi:hypothetical protein
LEKANISTWNVKDPYEKIKQGKLYQKSTKLCRFEVTLYDTQIDFNSLNPVEDIQFTLDVYADLFGLVLRNEIKNYDEMINHVALLHKLDESIISMLLKTGMSWSGNAKNRNLTRTLLRRGLLIRRGIGQYVTNPAFLKLFEGYIKPKEQKEYLPKFL